MNCASSKLPGRFRSAFSLLELLVAMLVTMIFMGAVVTTFTQISKGHKYAEARMDAMRNARTALGTMSEELKGVNKSGVAWNANTVSFRGEHLFLEYGDGYDNDNDGAVDEEVVNGVADAVTSGSLMDIDRHAKISDVLQERPLGVGLPDLGDAQVDVDAVFGRDTLSFVIYPATPTPEYASKRITYAVTTFEGEDNVLVRQVEVFPETGEPVVTLAPLAFKVAGLDLLYWNPNAQPADQGWVTDWNSEDTPSFAQPKLPLPAAVYVRLTMIADARPVEALGAGMTVETLPVETIVNVEEIIQDAQFPRPSL